MKTHIILNLLIPHFKRIVTKEPIISKRFYSVLSSNDVTFDVIVIGGGSGGLACAKEAANLNLKVAVLDFVDPSSHGTKWGLGGTCVNVGCIPKKLMHQAALLCHGAQDAHHFGISVGDSGNPNNAKVKINWLTLVNSVQNHVKSLNWGHRVQLKEKSVSYFNARGALLGDGKVKATLATGKQQILAGKSIVLALGVRPRFPKISGNELGISSDDLFSLAKPPGRTLVVGGSYVALECAGFLASFGFPTTLMIRSVPLRRFDQEMAKLAAQSVKDVGGQLALGVTPHCIRQSSDGRLIVGYGNETERFDTVLWAVGREPRLSGTGVKEVGCECNADSGRILVDDHERTSIENIYAIGDVAHERPELTPVAIQSGKLLARRLAGSSKALMNYSLVPSTIFTPIEYGFVGLSEKEIVDKFGPEKIEVYHSYYSPLEFSIPHWNSGSCYVKIICERGENGKVLSIHYCGPNAAEVTQGFAVALHSGCTFNQLQNTIAIHPSCAEEIVKLHISKRSGLDPRVTGC